jgi:Ser/Thr protein kinase RdoA (MazF antagonist)
VAPPGRRPTDPELAAAVGRLADARELVADGEEDAYRRLCDEVDRLDGGDGLPEAFTHPDFVMANVVASPDGIVVVDWAGAGRAPRLWSLAFLLYAEGTKDLRRVDRVVAGYRQHVRLEPEELDRLAAVMRARPLVFTVWAVCTGRSTAADAVAGLAELHSLTAAIADRARAAFADPQPVPRAR